MKHSARDTLNVVIVDDEKLARERIRRFLGEYEDVEIVAECDSGPHAVESIVRLGPDLVFLDIQMPDLDGFGVLSAVREHLPAGMAVPVVIFVTAYDQHALRAFDVHALDYIVKPFNEERLRSAIDHAREYLSGGRKQYDDRLAAMLAEQSDPVQRAGKESRLLDRIAIRSRDRIFFVKAADVEWIETAKNYVRLHIGDKSYRIRDSLTSLSSRLDPARFVRVHRRILINIDHVTEAQPWFSGDWVVLMKSGARLRMSRNYRELITTGRLF